MSGSNDGSFTLVLVVLGIVGFIVLLVRSVIAALGGSPLYWIGGGVLAVLTWRFRRIWWR